MGDEVGETEAAEEEEGVEVDEGELVEVEVLESSCSVLGLEFSEFTLSTKALPFFNRLC